jgi:hypothetical protein
MAVLVRGASQRMFVILGGALRFSGDRNCQCRKHQHTTVNIGCFSLEHLYFLCRTFKKLLLRCTWWSCGDGSGTEGGEGGRQNLPTSDTGNMTTCLRECGGPSPQLNLGLRVARFTARPSHHTTRNGQKESVTRGSGGAYNRWIACVRSEGGNCCLFHGCGAEGGERKRVGVAAHIFSADSMSTLSFGGRGVSPPSCDAGCGVAPRSLAMPTWSASTSAGASSAASSSSSSS